ncbi:RsmE family RNA methyltransferase [Anaerocellum danielii]|uniref:Ribosomal RNA small subunit methyltransferase E n=1 Tax=Anaerocellum danielii TaxID=1387557 RepID=A0ABZ0TWS7_9FIRM|nr:RsmE family RNA methyltransferase [Caldicellulosiruptor danielii]WPX07699.1 RsmE family RNA methyltransferase [Caldicellulosiruptor danielii]
MSIFFVEKQNVENDIAYITDKEDINHIVKVLRKRKGDKINLCDGKYDYSARIVEISRDKIKLLIEGKTLNDRESIKNIFLFQCIIKNQKMDIVIQKATELGVKTIVPVVSKRVVIDISEKQGKKVERWRKIAQEAQKQCLRPVSPLIEMPIRICEIKEKYLDKLDILLIPYEKELRPSRWSLPSDYNNIGILIGPEGGFEEEEIEELKTFKNVQVISLGKRILRSETASIAALSILMHELEEM